MKKLSLLLFALTFVLFSCKPEAEKPTVVTTSVGDVTETTAKVVGQVTADGGADVTERGVCWNTVSNPEITSNRIVEGTGLGTFTAELTDLEANTTYYVRAYATNEKGTSYGEEKSFTTKEIEEPGEPEEPGDDNPEEPEEPGDDNPEDPEEPGDDEPEEPEIPVVITVTTYKVSEITTNSAVCGGEVTIEGETVITSRGVCYAVNSNPTIEDNKTADGEGVGAFTSNITELSANTIYYVRAYAIDETGVFYGEEVSFTTLEEGGNTNGYEFVDLGLPSGLKWATCNVGATVPEEYGNYYAWGETQPKQSYNPNNCSTHQVEMDDISGDPQYDAARANWGGDWRMPTYEEMEELYTNCTKEISTQNGVAGYALTGPNGNTIFLPAAGFAYMNTIMANGTSCLYWTSTPYLEEEEHVKDSAYTLLLDTAMEGVGGIFRYMGQSVRPVIE